MTTGIHKLVDRQIARWRAEQKIRAESALDQATPRPVITISREYGSGGAEVAKEVAIRLNCELVGTSIVTEIAKSKKVREDLIAAMDEKVRSSLQLWLDKYILDHALDQDTYHRAMLEVLRSFIELGSVVILGRGAAYISTRRPKVNVFIVAPMENRIERVMQRLDCDRKEAIAEIKKSDEDRAFFIEKVFGKKWDDAHAFDAVINTGKVHISCVAAIVEALWFRYITDLTGEDPRQMRNAVI